MKISIINGPNLNLLGRRQPEVYGSRPFDEYLAALRAARPDVGIDYFQSNSEGALIALADAPRAVPVPAVEVHISNIHAREEFRSHSVTAPACRGVITGLGLEGYRLALDWIIGSRPAATE